jgi:hypothetical protein
MPNHAGRAQRAVSSLFLALAVMAAPALALAGPPIWLSPVSDQVTPRGFQVDADYKQLFVEGAPWQNAMSHVSVFEMVRRYVQSEPDENLQKIFAFLRQHNIPLGLATGAVPAPNCGDGVEGMAHHPDANVQTARKLQRLGADVKYLVMDEPLTFGHYFNGRNACHIPIDQLAAGVADEVRKFREVFPDVQVVDVEAHSGIGSPAELGQWLDALKSQLGAGAPFAVRFDVQWDSRKKPWQEFVVRQVDTVLKHGYRYALIVDGTPDDESDDAWIRTAESNVRAWESLVREPPDHLVIQSWHKHPAVVLPETGPTLPYLVNWVCQNSQMAQGCSK